MAQHTNLLRHLPLRYEQIVDEIITQLGGFSFQERAMNEMLARCWKAGHRKDWRTDKTVEEFEVKNDTLKLLDTGYGATAVMTVGGAILSGLRLML